MRSFIAGLIAGVVLCVATVVLAAWFWPVSVEATLQPGKLETLIIQRMLDRGVERQAPRVANPLPADDETLLAGMKLFRNGCAGCHGGATAQSEWGTTSFHPRVPQFGTHPPKRPDWQIFWIVKHGIRNTGMGAWTKLLPDDDIWKVATFVSRIDSLPPEVEAEWNKK